MIEILCTLTGIIAGVAIVASLFHQQGERAKFEADVRSPDTERIQGIAEQLKVISHRVAANVNAHSEKVESFSGRLAEPTSHQPDQILSTINEIINANQSMQGQLADAQKRIAQQSQMIEQASKQARTDALTGLANRRALDEFLGNCIESINPGEVVGLLLMDIDHFKNFNDSFGHTTGDAVLASFARSIGVCCGQECYAARFGGEEFAVILTAKSQDELALKAAQIRYYVSEQVISYEDLQLKITSSAGLCVLLDEDDINSCYERSDEGLYQAKKGGRNCGFWLGDKGWNPFPEMDGEPIALDADSSSTLDAESPTAVEDDVEVAAAASEEAARKSPEDTTEAETEEPKPDPSDSSKSNAAEPKEVSEVLDLKDFLVRLDAYVEQLRRADLPAAAVMVEALGLAEADSRAAAESWEAAVGLIQINLRGIDVVCLFRPFTLCVFMPGCSQEAAIDRAAKIQAGFRSAIPDWEAGASPSRLAVSVAQVDAGEKPANFLDRLEMGLDEAMDAGESELVIHTGDGCHFQEV